MNIHGLPPLDLNSLPPELAAQIRIPGTPLDEDESGIPEEAASLPAVQPEADAPAAPAGGDGRTVEEILRTAHDDPNLLVVPEPPWPATEEERAERERIVELMYPRTEKRVAEGREQANPSAAPSLPEGAYLRAQEQAERLRQLDLTPQSGSQEPESWLFGVGDRVAALWSPEAAGAQTAQCAAAPAWTQVGPAPFDLNNPLLPPPSIATNSGIVKAITLQPLNPSIFYLGSRGSGLWTTTTGGSQWFTLTDNLPAPNKTSLQIETIVVDGNILLAGTGIGPALGDGAMYTELDRSIGALRSTDAGLLQAPYEQIGPTWCTTAAGDASCRNAAGACTKSDPVACSGTTPTNSSITVRQLAIDKSIGTTRVWAATSKGLWSSDTALTASTPAGVIWIAVTPPGSCSSSCLPSASGTTPAPVNNILVSPLRDSGTTAFILYASVHGAAASSNNGWYRSVNRGGAWTKVGNTCSNCTLANPGGCASCLPATKILKAVIFPGAVSGSDTIYAVLENVPTSCGGSVSGQLRIYRSTDSGANWSLVDLSVGGSQTCEGAPCPVSPNCEVILGLQVHPTDANRIVVGTPSLFEATSVGMAQQSVRRVGYGILHADHNALTYHPTDSNTLYDGNDGGIWSIAMNASPTFTFRHGSNLANTEFYNGSMSTLNYGASFGGTQDNGDIKIGSGPIVWRNQLSGDGGTILPDPKDSNVEYHNYLSAVRKTVNGGIHSEITDHNSGLPIDPSSGVVEARPLAMDPVDNKSLIIYSRVATNQRVYRTTTAAEQSAPPAPAWLSIMSAPISGLDVTAFAIPPAVSPSPRSNLIYAGSGDVGGLYRTADASTWLHIDQHPGGQVQIPHGRDLSSLAIDTSTVCPAGQQLCSDGCACTIYATFSEPAAGGEIPGGVFRSTDSGRNWQQISGDCDATHPCAGGGCPSDFVCSGGLPALVAVNRIVIAPDNPDRVYIATDLGVYQGTRSGSTWSWCWYTTGFPKTAIVNDLGVHSDAGLLRAFTYGRSVWDVTAFTVGNPDQKVNTTAPATEVRSPHISSNTAGSLYALTWSDDRAGSNSQHVYLRGYQYAGNGQPSALKVSDVPIDDTSSHVAQLPAVAGAPALTTPPYCARVAWHDDRLGSGMQHIYFQYACSDGYRLYTSDQQADTAADRATNAAITAMDNGWFSVAWQAERGVPTLHDIYIRIFNAFGGAVTNPIKVNTSTADATLPATNTDSSNNTYVAWQEGAAAVLVRKYDVNGNPVGTPTPVAGATGGVVRQNVALADPRPANPPTIVVTWSESTNGGPDQVVARSCNSGLTSCATVVDGQCDRRCAGGSSSNASCGVDSECPGSTCTKTLGTVSCPPLEPPDARRAVTPAVAIDAGGNPVIAWRGNVNDRSATVWTGMARSFTPTLAVLKNDFRIDLAARTDVQNPSVARGNQAAKATFVWRDKRSGKYEIYTRAMPLN